MTICSAGLYTPNVEEIPDGSVSRLGSKDWTKRFRRFASRFRTTDKTTGRPRRFKRFANRLQPTDQATRSKRFVNGFERLGETDQNSPQIKTIGRDGPSVSRTAQASIQTLDETSRRVGTSDWTVYWTLARASIVGVAAYALKQRGQQSVETYGNNAHTSGLSRQSFSA